MKSTLTTCIVAVAAFGLSPLRAQDAERAAQALAEDVLQMSGRRAGICSMPRDAAPELAAALAKNFTVHAMAAADADVERAHALLDKAGLLGRSVYYEKGTPGDIPLAQWYCDIAVVADATDTNLPGLPGKEMWRVLSPYRGVALVGNPGGAGAGLSAAALKTWSVGLGGSAEIVEKSGGLWAVVRKGALAGMDEWTHFQHDGGNNPVSHDTVLQPPYAIQYITPPFTGAGGSSRFAGGRMFEMQGQQYKHGASRSLVASIWCRNAYNGRIIWQAPLPEYVDAKQLTAVATADTFYLLDNDKPGVRLIDPETGYLRKTISLGKEGEQCKWFALDDGRVVALVGRLAPAYPEDVTYHGRTSGQYRDTVRQAKLNHGLRVCAYDLDADKILWDYKVAPDVVDPRAVAAWDGKVAFLVEDPEYVFGGGDRAAENVKGKRLVCLDASTGAVLWENTDEKLSNLNRQYQFIFGREYYPGLIASTDGVRLRLMGIYGNDIMVFDPDDGSMRWKIDRTDKRYGMPETFAGFFVDGKYYHDKRVFSASSGDLLEERIPWDGGCGVRTWSPAGIFGNGNNGSTGLAIKSDCHMGSFVAGGVLNAARGWCDCNPVWRGTFALGPAGEVRNEPCKMLGSAADQLPDPLPVDAADWPTYRHDNDRTGATPAQVPTAGKILWHEAPQNPYDYVTQYEVYAMRRQDQPVEPIAAGGLVFVGGSDGAITCLDAASGQRRWRFFCAARLYAPPTVAEGRVYAGAADGRVYCLDPRTGRLLWCVRVALDDRRIMVAEHLVNRWPVLTGVLVHEGVAYAAAGLADVSGVCVAALDAATGAVKWCNTEAGTSEGLKHSLTPTGFMTVYGSKLYVANRLGLQGRFDLETGEQLLLPDYKRREGRMSWSDFGDTGREIAVLGDGFILEGGREIWHELNQRSGDRGYPSFNLKRFDADGNVRQRAMIRISAESIIPPAFDADGMAFVPGGFGRYNLPSGQRVESPNPRGTQGLIMLDTAAFLDMGRAAAAQSDGFGDEDDSRYHPCMGLTISGEKTGRGAGIPNYPEMYRGCPAFRWQYRDEWVQVNAVALAANAVVIARAVEAPGSRGEDASDYEPWTVAALSRVDGSVLWEYELPCEPMLNGLCIDRQGRVVVALRDGGVLCVGED